MSLERTDQEERHLHCGICSSALSEMEKLVLHNVCVFCSNPIQRISILKFVLHRVYQLKIFKLKIEFRKIFFKDASYMFIGILSVMGKTAEDDLDLKEQRALIKEMKKMLRGERGEKEKSN